MWVTPVSFFMQENNVLSIGEIPSLPHCPIRKTDFVFKGRNFRARQ